MRESLHTLQDWLTWQASLHHKEMDFDLSRLKSVFDKLLLPKLATKTVIVAGTNGKGSTVAMLESIYTHSGYRVGSYTSPHLLQYNERIRINGQAVSDQQLIGSFHTIEAIRGETTLTYFEYATLAACICFADNDLDVAILEVGLGGRLDATNIVDCDAAIFTSFSLDHQAFLGDTIEQIAAEKSQVMRPEQIAFCGQYNPPHALMDYAGKVGANLKIIGKDFDLRVNEDHWHIKKTEGGIEIGPMPLPSLNGRHQLRNAASVVNLCYAWQTALPITEQQINHGLTHISLSGRCEIIANSPEIIIDVAHNVGAVVELARYIKKLPTKAHCYVLLAILEDKDPQVFFEALDELTDSWFFAQLDTSRKLPLNRLKQSYLGYQQSNNTNTPASYHRSIAAALKKLAKHATADDRVIITGSFYTVAEALRLSS